MKIKIPIKIKILKKIKILMKIKILIKIKIQITRVTSVHLKEVVVWTSTVFVIVIAYSPIAAGVFVERSAETAFFRKPWARTP